jgi:hypothetical protein
VLVRELQQGHKGLTQTGECRVCGVCVYPWSTLGEGVNIDVIGLTAKGGGWAA